MSWSPKSAKTASVKLWLTPAPAPADPSSWKSFSTMVRVSWPRPSKLFGVYDDSVIRKFSTFLWVTLTMHAMSITLKPCFILMLAMGILCDFWGTWYLWHDPPELLPTTIPLADAGTTNAQSAACATRIRPATDLQPC